MDTSVEQVSKPDFGLLEAFMGEGFTAALRDGLSRSATVRSERPTAATPPPEAGRTVPKRSRGGLFRTGEKAAILERFEDRLPAILDERSPDSPASRSALRTYARTILSDAEGISEGGSGGVAKEPAAGAAVHDLPTGPGPRLAASGGVLLLECAMGHVAQGDGRHAPSARRAAAVAEAVGRAIRERAADDTPEAGGDTAEAVWCERRRLAREMHDGLGSALALTLRHLELHAGRRGAGGGAGDPHLAAAEQSVRDAVGHTRALVGGLREESAVPPMKDALRAFVQEMAPASLTVDIATTGNEQLLSDARRRELFLVVRECLKNAFAHSGARRITVTARVTRWWAHARVEDDGVGFDPESVAGHHGGRHGLPVMAERIRALGGRFTLTSTPGLGTRIDIHTPLRTESRPTSRRVNQLTHQAS
ncbi:sensor histidine kinase [Streptomyces sp. NPDC051217]|uniref:sensor histidine kinase n=1 Tax=Streptomyces sp. NPDC051217 TaxID=3365644 RepID=UPI0037B3F435